MKLLAALALTSADDLDPSRPLHIRGRELSIEAAIEAARILRGEAFDDRVTLLQRSVETHFYWNINHRIEGPGEIFAFADWDTPFPTAIETGIVRALAALPIERHTDVLSGGFQIAIGSPEGLASFQKIVALAKSPLAGNSILSQGGFTVEAHENCARLLTDTARQCLENSFITAPLKFRYLEIYRVIEALFIANVKEKMLARFDSEPRPALEEALESLKTEMMQILAIAESRQVVFEECSAAFRALNGHNQLITALFNKLQSRHKMFNGVNWKIGAAMIYLLRCAIVHAGQKDLIFENFGDGDAAISAVIMPTEKAALASVGFELS